MPKRSYAEAKKRATILAQDFSTSVIAVTLAVPCEISQLSLKTRLHSNSTRQWLRSMAYSDVIDLSPCGV